MATGLRKYHLAAYAYAGLGTLVVLLTLFFAIPARKAGLFFYLGPGFIFIIIFAFLVYKGFRKITIILSVLAGLRGLLFLTNFLGLHIEFPGWGYKTQVIFTQPFRLIFLINSLLMAVICYALLRAARKR